MGIRVDIAAVLLLGDWSESPFEWFGTVVRAEG